MAQLAQALGLAAPTDTAEHATARVLEALRRRDRWLLIFDDAVSARQLVRFLPPGPGHILVGSPDPEWRAHGTVLPVQRFTRAESIELLHTRLPALEAGEAGRLAAALEDLPLALDLAAATVTAIGMSVAVVMQRWAGLARFQALVPAIVVAAVVLVPGHYADPEHVRERAFLPDSQRVTPFFPLFARPESLFLKGRFSLLDSYVAGLQLIAPTNQGPVPPGEPARRSARRFYGRDRPGSPCGTGKS